MRKSLFTLTLILTFCSAFSQTNPRPTPSRFWNNNLSTFSTQPGDILVYQVTYNGKTYNLIATVKKYGDEIIFNYTIPETDIKGTASITATAVKFANSYVFTNNVKNLNDKSTLWISKDNYRDLASGDKQTRMDIGNGLDTFVRQSTSTQKVLYKGKEKIMTIYKVTNKNGRAGELSILTDPNNPLIVKMDFGWKAILKEVR